MEVSNLYLWIRKDFDLYCRSDRTTKLDWLILSAHNSVEEAEEALRTNSKEEGSL